MSPHLFVSYAHENAGVVQSVVRALEARGLNCWLDRDHLKAGDTLVGELNTALHEAGGFVLFLSQAYLESRWTQKELRVAVQLTLGDESRKLFIVRLDAAAIPAILADVLYTTYTSANQTASDIADRNRSSVATEPTELQWNGVPDHVVYALAHRIVERGASGEIQLEFDAGDGTKYRLRLVPFLVANEMLIEDLRLELDICRDIDKLIGHLRKRILEGGLGVFEGAFELNMERKQQELTNSRVTIRKQMSQIAPRIWLLPSRPVFEVQVS